MISERLPVKHIGVIFALCDDRLSANLRDDLGSDRYKGLGVRERYKDEKPYRICKRCIAVVVSSESDYLSYRKRMKERKERRDSRFLGDEVREGVRS